MGRDKGQGTIVPSKTPKGADRWRIAVTMADGRRVWRTARTPREAERIRKALVEARELDLDPTRQTLADWLRSWIAGLRDARNRRAVSDPSGRLLSTNRTQESRQGRSGLLR